MNNEKPLLSKINSNYILKSILSLAFSNMKSVLKLCKYNKCMLRKLDINFENIFKYEIETQTDINKDDIKVLGVIFLFNEALWFIFFLIYIILFYVRGKFNDKNLKEGYIKKKKDFVDFMDNYILLAYFLFNFVTILIMILLYLCNLFAIKGYIRLFICIFISLIDLIHHISYIIKFAYTKKLIKKELISLIMFPKDLTEEEEKERDKISKFIWFYRFDIFIISWICYHFLLQILGTLSVIITLYRGEFFTFGEIKKIFLNKFKGLNIIKKDLPEYFNNLNEKEKNEFLFKKENVKKYKYKLNKSQINLIQKINDIRKHNHIPLLKGYKIEKLPEFIINEKTQLIFNDYDNIFKLSQNFYIFKYRINEFQNFLNNNQILNIITNETLNKISVIEKNNFEFISIYDNNDSNAYRYTKDISLNIKKPNINLNSPKIKIDINTNIVNTEDKLNEKSERVSATEISENEGNEMPSIRNIKINKNNFEKK